MTTPVNAHPAMMAVIVPHIRSSTEIGSGGVLASFANVITVHE